MKTENINFKEKLNRLDEIVSLISNKTLSLDESIALYEEGSKIIKELQEELAKAEAKVEKVVDIK